MSSRPVQKAAYPAFNHSRLWGRLMARGKSNSLVFFTCLNCKALYQLLKVEAGAVDRAVTCLVCGAPLPSREGKFVLKYSLLRKAERPRKSKPHQMADATGS
jgi:hypothetical protein